MIIEGALSVKAALQAGNRTVNCVYLDQARHDSDAAFVMRTAGQMKVSVIHKSRAELDQMAEGRTHGGMLADVSGRKMQTLQECLQEKNPFLALVEGVEDPFNLGYIMRAFYCAGCSGILLRKRNWENAESTILRSSAGASEYIRTVMSDDLAEDVRTCRDQGLICYAAMRNDAQVYYEADFRQPFLIAIGGEMRGLSSAVLKQMDRNLYIPYSNGFRNALNAAGASAVFGFEAQRQRDTAYIGKKQ